jgi:hypothetical protein
MKNWIKLFGIIALVAVMGFSMVACKEEEEDKVEVEDTSGKVTITGLASFNGKYVMAAGEYIGQYPNYVAGTEIDTSGSINFGLVSNGQVVLRVWKASNELTKFSNYTGSDQSVIFQVRLHNGSTTNPSSSVVGTATVNFTNGTGTGNFTASP